MAGRIRVCHIITGLNTGGAETMLYKLLSAMDGEKFDSSVISLMDVGTIGGRIKKLGIPVYTINMKRGIPTPLGMVRLFRKVKSIHPHIIQGWMYHGNLAAQGISLFTFKKIPTLWNIRHSVYSLKDKKRLTGMLIKMGAYLSSRAEKVLYNSRVSARQHESIGYNQERTRVIPNGFDTRLFKKDQTSSESVKIELGIPKNTLLVGLIARYHPMKDHGNFLEAASKLSSTHPQVHFIMAGRGVDKNNEELMKKLHQHGLDGKVHLLGEREDIPKITAALDVAVSSSFSEAFPNAVGEAMASGVPCVVTDVGDSGWIVQDTGLIVPPKNPQALAEACREMIGLGKEEREKLGNAARERIIEQFSLPAIVVEYERLYKAVFNKKYDSKKEYK